MNKFVAGAMSAILMTAAGLSTAVPATAAPQHHDRSYYVARYCQDHPRTRDCRDWRSHGHRWDNNRYHNFYRSHQSAFPAFVGGLFGFALGAAAANAMSNDRDSNWERHVRACENRYRSYNARTDSFLGYDGVHHRCTL